MAVIFQPSAIMSPQVKALMKSSLRVNRRRKLNLFQLERAVSLHTWRFIPEVCAFPGAIGV